MAYKAGRAEGVTAMKHYGAGEGGRREQRPKNLFLGSSARIKRQVSAADREGLQGAKRSSSRRYCEYLQRGRPPEPANADGALMRAEGP
ncbi:hypothetical protein DBR12_11535 [Acidovorax sp. HMWF029]|nr:hypothetical protein DBR12_11535 [Acidovorax sp. HMWF029]